MGARASKSGAMRAATSSAMAAALGVGGVNDDVNDEVDDDLCVEALLVSFALYGHHHH